VQHDRRRRIARIEVFVDLVQDLPVVPLEVALQGQVAQRRGGAVVYPATEQIVRLAGRQGTVVGQKARYDIQLLELVGVGKTALSLGKVDRFRALLQVRIVLNGLAVKALRHIRALLGPRRHHAAERQGASDGDFTQRYAVHGCCFVFSCVVGYLVL
jgi:hypothetical protein